MKQSFLLLILLTLISRATIAQTNQQPNIFIVIADDLGYGDLGITGHPFIKTPHIDSFAMQSRQLKYYAAHPVCSPSRIGLMTGQFPQRQGVHYIIQSDTENEYELKTTEASIPQILDDLGYSTFHCGKWHMNYNEMTDSISQALGFDHFTPIGNKPSKIVFDKAQAYITQSLQNDSLQPIFGYIALNDVHTPILPKIQPPFDQFIALNQYDTITTDQLCHYGVSFIDDNEENFGYNIRNYYGIVSSMDDAFGDFLSYLDSLGIRDNSIILFTSDNGPAAGPGETLDAWGTAGCGMSGVKSQLYEGGIRVPGFISWPGRWDDGDTVQTPTCAVDLLPTLANITGAIVPNPSQIDGQDVGSIWDKTVFIRQKPLFWMNIWPIERDYDYGDSGLFFGQLSMLSTDGTKKLIGQLSCLNLLDSANYKVSTYARRADFGQTTKKLLMYDLSTDPLEKVNLAVSSPQVFNDLFAQFRILDKQVRRSGPAFNSENKRYNTPLRCSSCDSMPEPQCPTGPLLTSGDIVPDLSMYAKMDLCNLETLTYYQWPPIGTPFTGETNIELHIMRDKDHLKVCNAQLIVGDEPPTVFLVKKRNQASCLWPDGNIEILVEGGIPPYQYLWDNGATTSKIWGLTGGTYTVTVTSGSGLSATKPISIQNLQITTPVTVLPVVQTVDCLEPFTLTASGGSFYQWSHSSGNDSTETFAIDARTSIVVTITDSLGCSTSISALVKVRPQLVDEVELMLPTCPNFSDTAWVQWSGPIDGNYTVKLNPLNDTTAATYIPTTGTTAVLTGLVPGTIYQVAINQFCGPNAGAYSTPVEWIQPECNLINNELLDGVLGIRFFPSPSTDVINIVWINQVPNKNLRIDLFDIHGKLIESKDVPAQLGYENFDIHSLPAACYILQFSLNGERVGGKVFAVIH
jgi:arylsulfatase A